MSRGAAAVTAVAVVVCAAAVATAGRTTGPLPDSAAHSRTVPVSTAVLTCPGRGPDRHVDTTVFAASWAPHAQRGRGALTVAPLPSPLGGPRGRLSVRGRSLSLPGGSNSGPAEVRGVGALAPGATGASWSLPRDPGKSLGAAVTACLPLAGDWWFAGAATSLGARSTLALTNPSSSVVVVDVALFGPDGVVAAPGARGIAVAPRSTRSIDLARFAPALPALTVNVHAVATYSGSAGIMALSVRPGAYTVRRPAVRAVAGTP